MSEFIDDEAASHEEEEELSDDIEMEKSFVMNKKVDETVDRMSMSESEEETFTENTAEHSEYSLQQRRIHNSKRHQQASELSVHFSFSHHSLNEEDDSIVSRSFQDVASYSMHSFGGGNIHDSYIIYTPGNEPMHVGENEPLPIKKPSYVGGNVLDCQKFNKSEQTNNQTVADEDFPYNSDTRNLEFLSQSLSEILQECGIDLDEFPPSDGPMFNPWLRKVINMSWADVRVLGEPNYEPLRVQLGEAKIDKFHSFKQLLMYATRLLMRTDQNIVTEAQRFIDTLYKAYSLFYKMTFTFDLYMAARQISLFDEEKPIQFTIPYDLSEDAANGCEKRKDNELLMMKDTLRAEAQRRMLRRVKTEIFEPVYVDSHTFAWSYKLLSDIDEWVVKTITTNYGRVMFEAFEGKRGNANDVINYFKDRGGLINLKTTRHMISFRNGVYFVPHARFVPHSEMSNSLLLAPNVFSCNFIDEEFMVYPMYRNVELAMPHEFFENQETPVNQNTIYEIPTPNLDRIMHDQQWPYAVRCSLYVAIGRLLYDQDFLDSEQIAVFFNGRKATGKCFQRGTEVLMSNGLFKPIELVEIGELVMGDDGTSRTVKSLARGREQMAKVHFQYSDSEFVCNVSHILSLQFFSSPRCYIDGSNYVVEVYIYNGHFSSIVLESTRYATDCEAEYVINNLHLYPLTLGQKILLYGDTVDISVKAFLNSHHTIQQMFMAYHPTDPMKFDVDHGEFDSDPYMFGFSMKQLSMRAVPNSVKYGSVDTRNGFLQGVIDSFMGKKISFNFSLLLDDVVFIARSLGKTVIHDRKTHTLEITASEECNSEHFTIHLLEGEDDYYGFALDGNARFVVTKSMIVTHNSTICNLAGSFYPRHLVSTVATTGERVFGLEAFIGSFLVLNPEVRENWAMDSSDFLRMVAGDDVSVARKFRTARTVQWRSAFVLAGNEVPGWNDDYAALARRMLIFSFTKSVNKDSEFWSRLLAERPAIIHKCNLYYLAAARYFSGSSFRWPKYFRETRDTYLKKVSPIFAFLTSNKVTVGKNLFVPFTALIDEYKQEAKRNASGNARPRINDSVETWRAAVEDLEGEVSITDEKEKRCYPDNSNQIFDYFFIGLDLSTNAMKEPVEFI